jgi:nitrogen fixation protein
MQALSSYDPKKGIENPVWAAQKGDPRGPEIHTVIDITTRIA